VLVKDRCAVNELVNTLRKTFGLTEILDANLFFKEVC
jgi:hypothetical protein